MSVRNYRYSLRNDTEVRISHQLAAEASNHAYQTRACFKEDVMSPYADFRRD